MPAARPRPRLRRSDCARPGIARVRRGRGFSYVEATGERVSDPETVERLQGLAIPPAWQEVWICADPWGHLQATGIDAAGRKQYLYHPRWRERRDQEKFERMERFGRALPKMRRSVARELRQSEPTREAVLACAIRLLDVGLFRVGSEQYAEEDHGIGLATVRRAHVRVAADTIVFDYPAKGGKRRVHEITDPASRDLVEILRRRRRGPEELLAYHSGRRWCPVRSEDVNDFLKSITAPEFSAKDFRTWNATVLAAVSLGTAAPDPRTKTARKRAIDGAVRGVSEILGNTPAVARRSYIDPRVFDRYLSGWTIAPALERLGEIDPARDRDRARLESAVLDLLDERRDATTLHRAEAA